MGRKESIGIGLMGLGVVGGGVAKALTERAEAIAAQVGCPLRLRKILERDLAKTRASKMEPHLFTTDAAEVIGDPEIDIIIEALGGERPAFDFIKEAMGRGKHVVTSNKEVMAKHFPELLSLAKEKGVDILYEASVGGGIPLIAPFKQDLSANEISAIHAIINGTTNYILTRMAAEGLDFSSALKQAQKLGYAEADPTNDIEGIDAAYKLAILATLAFHTEVRPDDVYHEGISRLSSRDFRYARELGYAIKLLAIAKEKDGSIEVRVHPVFIPEDLLLAKVDGVYNAVQVEGDLVGRVLFYGQGAGALPTSSAVVADVINLAQRIKLGVSITPSLRLDPTKKIKPISEIETRYYIRMSTQDRPGVLAQISKILGDHLISISSVIQKETDVAAQVAEIVIMTYPARESAMRKALNEIERLEVVKEVSNFVRVED
ncbi:MAG: homoserine dehydrogenase [Dehalococcoidia bacterium]|nr:MAG: homoserine dehydrogenase [Dehalococcoidia bacterium]